MKPPFKIEWLLVTPAMAAAWLKQNIGNRPLKGPTLESYQRDMRNGEWMPTHQGIAFGTSGRLIDGQHRLMAIVATGVAVEMLVCSDVPERVEGKASKVMDAVDRGATRSIPDILRLQHGLTVDTNMIVAASLLVGQLCVDSPDRIKRSTVAQLLPIIENYRAAFAFVSENRPRQSGLRAAPICAAFTFAYVAAPEVVGPFFKGFATGLELSAGSPVLWLRNFCMDNPSGRKSCAQRLDDLRLVLYAIDCFRRGETLERLPAPEKRMAAAKWFADRQPKNIKAIQALFADTMAVREPKLTLEADRLIRRSGGVDAAPDGGVKLTPLAESILRAKDVSERINRKVARAGRA